MKLSIGDLAPDFRLPDQNNHFYSLSDFHGSYLVLYFYPKDDTPGCTVEACSFRDFFPQFQKLDLRVCGISADKVKKHQKFTQKYKLPFILLADENKEIIQSYGVWGKKKFMGKEFEGILRTTFIIDPKGKIVQIYHNVKPKNHAEEILEDSSVFMKKKLG